MGRFLVFVLVVLAVVYFIPAPVNRHAAGLEIEASREQVWEVMSDLARLPRWIETVDSVAFLNPQRQGLGAELRIDGTVMSSVLRVARWVPYNTVAFDVRMRPGLTHDHVLRYTVERRFAGRSVVRVEEEYRMAGGYLGHVLGGLLFDRMRDPYRASALLHLKRLVETGAGLGT